LFSKKSTSCTIYAKAGRVHIATFGLHFLKIDKLDEYVFRYWNSRNLVFWVKFAYFQPHPNSRFNYEFLHVGLFYTGTKTCNLRIFEQVSSNCPYKCHTSLRFHSLLLLLSILLYIYDCLIPTLHFETFFYFSHMKNGKVLVSCWEKYYFFCGFSRFRVECPKSARS
jgi:hypothetical protein